MNFQSVTFDGLFMTQCVVYLDGKFVDLVKRLAKDPSSIPMFVGEVKFTDGKLESCKLRFWDDWPSEAFDLVEAASEWMESV